MNIEIRSHGHTFLADVLDVRPPCAPRVDIYRDGTWVAHCCWSGSQLTGLDKLALIDDLHPAADVVRALEEDIFKAFRS
jgi:hypothetical protein